MKVYSVLSTREWEDYEPDVTVVGVASSMERAKEIQAQEVKTLGENWDYDENETTVEETDTTVCYMNNCAMADYFSVEIKEHELDA